MTPPKVFVSYSHDNPGHKQWVLELASKLRQGGVDAILDQWDLRLGEDVTRFMESGIQDCERVVVVLSEGYVQKAENGVGGVGYERQIVTAELIQNLGTTKFIPVVRANPERKVPAFLGYRLYLDFTDDTNYEIHIDLLLREIHGIPPQSKPPIGSNPYAGETPPVVTPAQSRSPGVGGEKAATQPRDASATRRMLEPPATVMSLHDWILPILARAKEDLVAGGIAALGSKPSPELVAERVQMILRVVGPLSVDFGIGGYWANQAQSEVFAKALLKLTKFPDPQGAFYEMWQHMEKLPALLLSTAMGTAAVESRGWTRLKTLLEMRVPARQSGDPELPYVVWLHKGAPFAQDFWRMLPEKERLYFPVASVVEEFLRPMTGALYVELDHLPTLLDHYDLIASMAYGDLTTPGGTFGFWAPLAAYVWRRPEMIKQMRQEIEREGSGWGPTMAGMFQGKPARALEILSGLEEFIWKVRSQRGIF